MCFTELKGNFGIKTIILAQLMSYYVHVHMEPCQRDICITDYNLQRLLIHLHKTISKAKMTDMKIIHYIGRMI